MSLSRFERKERLLYGSQKEIAQAEGVAESMVSRVMNDKALHDDPKKVRRIQVRIARKIGLPVSEVFPGAESVSSSHSTVAA